SGLFDENFNRGAGWYFYDIGRRIERGINTCRFARQLADKPSTDNNLDVLLDLIDSQITFRSRYLTGVAPAPVRDMALLDPYNPRSVAFQVFAIDDHIAGLPVLRQDGVLEEPRRLSTQLRAELSTEDADRMDARAILAVEQKLANLADAIGARYFLQAGKARRAEKIMGLA
ncbi:MAG TPA: alpha-E domain-containing protein, partial [Roseiarcus sp.]|nr:alpha-E domain-containing protein [Roseiarcus sp.]